MADSPASVGPYRIVRPLGRGRLGDLFLVHDPLPDGLRALRLLPALRRETNDKYHALIAALARLQHRVLAPVLAFGLHEDRLFFTTEYIDGPTLAQLIESKAIESPPLPRRLEWVATVCDALRYVHTQGVCPLFLTSSSIVLSQDGTPRLVDIALPPIVDDDAAVDPSYRSPEAIAGRAGDRRSDVFSAGVLLYELVTCEKPFGDGTAAEIEQRISDGAQWTRRDALGPDLAAIVTRALQFTPEARYPDFGEFLADLARAGGVFQRSDTHRPPLSQPVPESASPAPGVELFQRRSAQLTRHLDDASAALRDESYQLAVDYAERALLIEAGNPQALHIIQQARAQLDAVRVAAAIEEARRQFAKGELQQMRAALEQASTLDPANAELRGLRVSLERELREREASHHREKPLPSSLVVGPQRVDENVRFTVYRPAAMAPRQWYPLLFLTHLAERRPDAPAGEPDPMEEVERVARRALGADAGRFPRLMQDAAAAVPHEALLRIVPSVEGVVFNPPEYSFLWLESVHRADFKIRADASLDGRTAHGTIEVRMGAIPIGVVHVRIPIDARAPAHEPAAEEAGHPYRRIFASYSHKDTAIVQQFETYARGIGDSYMRDVINLRAGELWNDELLRWIDQADVFQLFWSTNSMQSPFVRREWEHALTVNKSHFVRPLYWETPFPERDGLPPPELKARHFASVAIAEKLDLQEVEHRRMEARLAEDARRELERRAVEQRDRERQEAEQRARERHDAEQRQREQREAEQRARERRELERRTVEERERERQEAEQRAREQQALEWREHERRQAELREQERQAFERREQDALMRARELEARRRQEMRELETEPPHPQGADALRPPDDPAYEPRAAEAHSPARPPAREVLIDGTRRYQRRTASRPASRIGAVALLLLLLALAGAVLMTRC